MEERLSVWKALGHRKTQEDEKIFPLTVELMERKSKGKAADQCDDGTLQN